jgi:hypothetical protein
MANPENVVGKGFKALGKRMHRAVSSVGGKTAHARGNAHEWTSEEAKAAGRKGGLARAARLQRDRELENERNNPKKESADAQ